MELSSFKRITIQHQFDRFAKLVIAGEAKKHKKELVRRSSNEKLFSELSSAALKRRTETTVADLDSRVLQLPKY